MNERIILELDAETLAAAREAGLDLAELLSQALRRVLPPLDPFEREQLARRWYEENKQAVDSYNHLVKEYGLFSDGVRMF
jgi:post-segregation antitoxin (ccd killing protein)